jgi:tripartite-type tricarboxylate transporter receptor subunit TctC
MKRNVLFVLAVLILGVSVMSSCSKPAKTEAGAAETPKSSGIFRETGTNVVKLNRENGEVFPNRQIELIVPMAAGGGTDVFCRQIAAALYDIVGVPVVVTNVTGASSLRGIGMVYNARPDGYTLVAFNPPSEPMSEMLTNPGFTMRDLTTISYYAVDAVILATHPSLGIKTFDDAKALYARGDYKGVGGGSVGSLTDIGAKLLKTNAGFNFETTVTYNGSGDVVGALLRKEVAVACLTAGAAINAILDGDLLPIMVLTTKRFPALPDVPAYGDDLGYSSIDAITQQNRIICGPPALPDDIAEYLETVITQACQNPELRKWAEEKGLPVLGLPRTEARRVLDLSYDIPKLINLDDYR